MTPEFAPFYDAATMGDRKTVEAMLAKNPKLVGARDDMGFTALHGIAGQDEPELAELLIDRGADVNAKAALDADGFGGHTPLFHTAVTLATPDDSKARLLLERGAAPNARATIRKQLRDMGDPEKERMREFHNITPIGYARQFQEPSWVNGPAITAIAERGGTE